MTEEQRLRLEELRQEHFRNHEKESLINKLQNRLRAESYHILDPNMKDYIQNGTDDWPTDKWDKNLYVQVEISNRGIINTILSQFVKVNPFDYVYVFLSGYFSLILQVANETLVGEWISLIDADEDDITCYIPGRKDYICIELVQEKLGGKQDEGFNWLYELTFSNEKLKAELLKDRA